MFAKFYLGKTNNEKLLQTCVKWHNVWSRWFRLSCGIRQGGVLSPYLFAIYIDNLVERVQAYSYGCYLRNICISIILYADDVLLLALCVKKNFIG